jgi:pantothenate kinase
MKKRRKLKSAVVKDEIRIIIAGKAAIGKTTVMQIIIDALAEKGFPIDVVVDDFPVMLDSYLQDRRIMSLKGNKKLRIKLEERHLYENPLTSAYAIAGLKEVD